MPVSLQAWGRELAKHDGYGHDRSSYPPTNAVALAVVRHMFAALNQERI